MTPRPRTSRPLAVLVAAVASAACAVPRAHAQSASASSEASHYAVRGAIEARAAVRGSTVTVVVSSASVLSMTDDCDIHLRAWLSTNTATHWMPQAASGQHSLGAFVARQRRAIRGPLTFTIAVPPGVDPRSSWIAFEFVLSDGTTTYACADLTLGGASAWSATRAAKARGAYAMGC